jgi:hypothetical protein
MRLAFLTNNRFPPREGIAWHVLEVAQRMQARGHVVTVLEHFHADWNLIPIHGTARM